MSYIKYSARKAQIKDDQIQKCTVNRCWDPSFAAVLSNIWDSDTTSAAGWVRTMMDVFMAYITCSRVSGGWRGKSDLLLARSKLQILKMHVQFRIQNIIFKFENSTLSLNTDLIQIERYGAPSAQVHWGWQQSQVRATGSKEAAPWDCLYGDPWYRRSLACYQGEFMSLDRCTGILWHVCLIILVTTIWPNLTRVSVPCVSDSWNETWAWTRPELEFGHGIRCQFASQTQLCSCFLFGCDVGSQA